MNKKIIELDASNFEELTSKGDWAIDFWAEWCGPCKIMSPEFDKAAEELDGKVKFGKINVDKEFELAQRFEVMSIPAMVIMRNGQEKDRTVGAIGKKDILSAIDRAVK
ncbi:MAG: thioredoxin [Nanoarchaeota archaeon]|nr:thioredoxin [Nanoarchaeota archaeon]